MLGTFRDGHPRITLTLPGAEGAFEVEFIVDTGYEGDLALPGSLARQLDAQSSGFTKRALADGSIIVCPFLQLPLEWDGQIKLVQVLVLPGNPLLGTAFLKEHSLQVEVTEGGEVYAEPL